MYQTGGLFHPLLSQRIYQSNQGLKLSAKAFQLPKGTFICLKSRGLPSDRGLICNRRGRASSLEGPTGWPPLTLSSTPTSLPLHVLLWLHLSWPYFQMSPSSPLGFSWQAPLSKVTHLIWANPPNLTQVRTPSLTGTLMVMVGAPIVTTFLWRFVMFSCNGYFCYPVPWMWLCCTREYNGL